MYQYLLKQPTNLELKPKHKLYRNKVNSLIKKTRKDYYEKQIVKNKYCSKTLWKITQYIIKSQKQNKDIQQIKINNNCVENCQREMVDAFNKSLLRGRRKISK